MTGRVARQCASLPQNQSIVERLKIAHSILYWLCWWKASVPENVRTEKKNRPPKPRLRQAAGRRLCPFLKNTKEFCARKRSFLFPFGDDDPPTQADALRDYKIEPVAV